MKASDTVMTFMEQSNEMKTAKALPGCLVRKQAEISFKAGQEEGISHRYGIETLVDIGNDAFRDGKKAGIKEVVEWVNSERKNQNPSVWYSRWQAKLKGWGL